MALLTFCSSCLHPLVATVQRSVCLPRLKMLLKSLALLACASCALAHGDHDHDQTPISGPHKSLWYNTLPGDGGTQVSRGTIRVLFGRLLTRGTGRFCLLRNLDVWSTPLLPMPRE